MVGFWPVERGEGMREHRGDTRRLGRIVRAAETLVVPWAGRRQPEDQAWEGMAPASPTDTIGLLLDLHAGSMTLYKNR